MYHSSGKRYLQRFSSGVIRSTCEACIEFITRYFGLDREELEMFEESKGFPTVISREGTFRRIPVGWDVEFFREISAIINVR